MGFKGRSALKIMIVLLLLSLFACAGVERKVEDSAVQKIRGFHERLVQSDVTARNPIWCGVDALIYTTKEDGAFMYDLITEQKLKLGGPDYLPVACTPDGEWIIYADKTSYQWVDKDDYEQGINKELWRYEFTTEKKEKFLVVGSREYPLSVEEHNKGFRLYPGKKPHMQIEMREPRWDVVWSLDKKTYNELLLKDYSAALGVYRDYEKKRNVLEVETFTPAKKYLL